jgi:hypothetical protein
VTPSASPKPRAPAGLLDWLRGVNDQLAGWAAQASWWRMVLLFLLVLIVGSILLSRLNLKHDYVRVPVSGKDPVVVEIGGKDGIRISQSGRVTQPKPPEVPASDARGMAKEESDLDPNPNPLSNDDDEDDRMVAKRVWTYRGLVGDIATTLMILFFAYMTAAKIVVRRVAQADAKVRTAEDAAGREAMERQLVQAQLQVLQAQVEPHFLFNTLAAVDYLIETDPARASLMQKKLITYLRGALPQMRQESSTLGRELRLIRSYLDLIKMRIEERLEVEIDVADFLETAEFPPMMLQSLVENAIKHGIEPKPEGGKVTVSAKIQRGMLWVEVKDSGVGVVDTDRLESPTAGTGIGLRNIRERLAVLYPGKGRLTLVSDDRAGTAVRIGVPYREGEDTESAGAGEEQPA